MKVWQALLFPALTLHSVRGRCLHILMGSKKLGLRFGRLEVILLDTIDTPKSARWFSCRFSLIIYLLLQLDAYQSRKALKKVLFIQSCLRL